MKFIFGIILLLVTIILIYILIQKIIVMYTGCSQEDADEIIQRKISDLYYSYTKTSPYHISTDPALATDVWNTYNSIFDEKRIEALQKLTRTNVICDSGDESGIRYLKYTVISPTEHEKTMFENSLKALLIKYLKAHNMAQLVLVEWQTHSTLSLLF